MNELHVLLIFHLLGAVIWVGGHLVLSLSILPSIIKEKAVDKLFYFEERYERIGMPALLLLVLTGWRMAYLYGVTFASLFSFRTPIEVVISLKVLCLLVIIAFAISAQFYVLPRLKRDSAFLPIMTLHIITVTLFSVLMLVLGSFIRFGGI